MFLAQKSAFLARDALVPALRENRSLSRQERAVYSSTVRLGVNRFLALVGQSYEKGFLEHAIRGRRRQRVSRAITSILAGDIYDDENPLLRQNFMGR